MNVTIKHQETGTLKLNEDGVFECQHDNTRFEKEEDWPMYPDQQMVYYYWVKICDDCGRSLEFDDWELEGLN